MEKSSPRKLNASPSTSFASRNNFKTVNALNKVLTELNDSDSQTEEERKRCFDNLRNFYKNKSDEEFAGMVLEAMKYNKTPLCKICGKEGKNTYDKAQHIIIDHNVYLELDPNASLIKNLTMEDLYGELKLISENSLDKNMQLRDDMRRICPDLLKKLDDKLIEGFFDDTQQLYNCHLCRKNPHPGGHDLAEHFFTQHKFFWRIEESDLLQMMKTIGTDDSFMLNKPIPRMRTSIGKGNTGPRQSGKRSHHTMDNIDANYSNGNNSKIRKIDSPKLEEITVTTLDQLADEMNRYVIQATIASITKTKDGQFLEIHLNDSSEKPFKCVLPKSLYTNFTPKIKEGNEYYFKKVDIRPYKRLYYIGLRIDSEVELVEDVLLSNIQNRQKAGYLPLRVIRELSVGDKVDVVGMITSIGEEMEKGTTLDGKKKYIRELEIVDDSRNTANLALWENQALHCKYKKDDIISIRNGHIYEYWQKNRISISKNTTVAIDDFSDPHVERLRKYFKK